VFVEKSVHDQFLELLIKRASAIRTGDPLAPETTMGPVISGKQQEGILNAIAEAKRQGATVAYEGRLPTLNGYFIAPTIFTGVRPDMTVAQNEIFGPVLGVAAFEGEQQAIDLANNSRYSLAASVWTRDIGQAHRMARKIRAGTVWVNTYGPTDTRLPWGGMGGDSGFGRDLGREALHNYTERKTVWIQTG
jgi:aldehyde dehydrogenase (NAD+)